MESRFQAFLTTWLAANAEPHGECTIVKRNPRKPERPRRVPIPMRFRLQQQRPSAIIARRAAWIVDRGIDISDRRVTVLPCRVDPRCGNFDCVDPKHLRCSAFNEF